MSTNSERWQIYTSDLCSPQNYIDWTWRYIITSALQRRVWLGLGSLKCYPPIYNILVGKPGIGKGVVIRRAEKVLSHWKIKDSINIDKSRLAEMPPLMLGGDLITLAPATATYEALVHKMAEATMWVSYTEQVNGEVKRKNYGHSSLTFCLHELESLFRKHTNDLIAFLRQMYDCTDRSFDALTISRKEDSVKNGCLNLLAGADPDFMQNLFNDRLVEGGFLSRTFLIHAKRNRKSVFLPPTLTQEQLDCEREILEHILKLTGLFGPIKISKETLDALQDWWEHYEQDILPKEPVKLLFFNARMNIHVMKVAIAEHFSESLEMEIPLDTFIKATKIIEKEKENMCSALSVEQITAVSRCCQVILSSLITGRKNWVDLYCNTVGIASKEELNDAIEFLRDSKQITIRQEEDEETGKQVMYYELKKGNTDDTQGAS